MHRIYFEKRSLVICGNDDPSLSDPNAVEFRLGDRLDIHTFVGMFESSPSLQKIYIPSDDIEGTYRRVCKEFKEVNAAGGLVSNRRGDYLLINRNSLWDLPKGHQEEGEDIAAVSYTHLRAHET